MLKVILLYLSLFSISSANASIMEVIPLHNRPASELIPLISPLLERSEHIIDNGSNLIIKASPARLEEIKLLITKLDKGLSNLAITVLQSKSKTAEDLNASINIKALDHPSNLSGRTRGRYANTEELDSNDSTQVVRTLEGRPAYIKIGGIYPVNSYSVSGWGRGGRRGGNRRRRDTDISSDTQFIEATKGFSVTARLTDRQVTIGVSPWSDKMNKQGIIETQSASTILQAKLGEWVEIGNVSESIQTTRDGHISHRYSTKHTTIRILIKVEKLN
jgi:hypothetical protein